MITQNNNNTTIKEVAGNVPPNVEGSSGGQPYGKRDHSSSDNNDDDAGYGFEVVHQRLSLCKQINTVCPPRPNSSITSATATDRASINDTLLDDDDSDSVMVDEDGYSCTASDKEDDFDDEDKDCEEPSHSHINAPGPSSSYLQSILAALAFERVVAVPSPARPPKSAPKAVPPALVQLTSMYTGCHTHDKEQHHHQQGDTTTTTTSSSASNTNNHSDNVETRGTLTRKYTSFQDETEESSNSHNDGPGRRKDNATTTGALVVQEEEEGASETQASTATTFKQNDDDDLYQRNLFLAAYRANQQPHDHDRQGTTTQQRRRNHPSSHAITTTDSSNSITPARDHHKQQNKNTIIAKPSSRVLRVRRTLVTQWRNSKVEMVWTLFYICANALCFVSKFLHYYYQRPDATAVFGCCIMVARGAAHCLNLNCALILLPMCRLALTHIRGWNQIKQWVPLDSSVLSHKRIGCVIAFWTAVHVGAHIGDFYKFSQPTTTPEAIYTLMHGKLGMDTMDDVPMDVWGRWTLVLQSRAAITGILMVVCMVVAYGCTLLQSRLPGGFNTFWYTHHLLLVMLALLMIHGTGNLLEPFESIYWVGVPLLLYGLPRLYRECRWFNQPRQVLEIRVKEGGQVVVLRLSKPAESRNWFFNKGRPQMKAGMYFNLNIPQLARYEWHPFSNTATPGDDFIEFHIRKAGDWTDRLCDMAHDLVVDDEEAVASDEEKQTRRTSDSSESRRSTTSIMSLEQANHDHRRRRLGDSTKARCNIPLSLKVYVEGPIGASSQGFEDHRIIVLCGAGVGATPMISVLKELLQNRSSYRMQRTYFFWAFRDVEALEWFASLLDDVFYTNNNTDGSSVVEGRDLFVLRLFLTSKKDTETCGGSSSFVHRSKSFRQIELDDSRMERINPHYKVDFGRPRWYEELSAVQYEAKLLGQKKAGVFISGSPKMARAVQRTTVKISKRDPKFHFYCRKETFCGG